MRAYPPEEEYRRREFYHQDALYLADPAYVVSVTKVDPANQHDVWTDQSWVYPEEVRVLSAVALSIPEGRGMIAFKSDGRTRQLDLAWDTELTTEPSLDAIQATAVAYAWECYGSRASYQLRDTESSDVAFEHALFTGIDVSDQLLIRGLYSLLKSQHLLRAVDGRFMEEAIMNVQIAREAGLDLIRHRLIQAGMQNASFQDAYEYLRNNFRLGDALASYFKEQHDTWIAVRHPDSRFGPHWAPRLMADDYYETYGACVSVYRHLLAGEQGRNTAFDFTPEP